MSFAIGSSTIKASVTAANLVKPVTYTTVTLETPGATANRAPAAAAVAVAAGAMDPTEALQAAVVTTCYAGNVVKRGISLEDVRR
jgi:hypothetical protein